MNSRVIEGAYLRDLLAQPDVLQGLTASLAARSLDAAVADGLRDGRLRRVVLTGMGSSWHALYPLHLRLSAAGFASSWLEASELLLGFAALRAPDTLRILVSQSGESAEIVRLLATAGTGGLILKESTRQPSEGMSCAAFRHGPFEMVSERVLVLLCAGDARTAPLHERLAADIAKAGGRVGFLSADATSAPVFRLAPASRDLRPLLEILPVQMLSLAVAARDGREAGRFERAAKITTDE